MKIDVGVVLTLFGLWSHSGRSPIRKIIHENLEVLLCFIFMKIMIFQNGPQNFERNKRWVNIGNAFLQKTITTAKD